LQRGWGEGRKREKGTRAHIGSQSGDGGSRKGKRPDLGKTRPARTVHYAAQKKRKEGVILPAARIRGKAHPERGRKTGVQPYFRLD